jgi:hypothetical protein
VEEFKKKGLPIVRIKEKSFELKAIDYWEFRTFEYDSITRINYSQNIDKWAGGGLTLLRIWLDPYEVTIYLKDGESWKYTTKGKYDKDFAKLIKTMCEGNKIKVEITE